MRLIELDRAASEIKQAWEDIGAEPRRSPFFLIVGAGISYPPVPLAVSIIEHCERTARQYQRGVTSDGDRTLDKYSYWFSCAYPHARQRQKYFRQLIENQPISLANLRLAHLLSARKLTNLVVTTNFDDFLIKALRLFGQTPAVCDHPSTVARIDFDSTDIQVVYAHGSYLFYDLANLQGEVTGRAQPDRDTSLTMMGLLDNLLWNRSPIVVGYSGWEGDVIMSALKRRVRGGHPLGQSIYWCCYKHDVPAQMPEWLRNSGDVQFVVPPEKLAAVEEATSRGSGESSQIALTAAPADTAPVLTAREVFERLGQALGAEDPPLLADPLNFLADQLTAALPKDEAVEGGSDPYGFKRLIQRIRAAAGQQPKAEKELIKKLEAVTTCIRRSQYANAVRAAAAIVPQRLNELTADQRKSLLDGVALAADALLAKDALPDKKKIDSDSIPELARVFLFDIRAEEEIGPLPDGMAILLPARTGHMLWEHTATGRPRGAFLLALEQTLQRAAKTGRSHSLQDVLAETAATMLNGSQSPVLIGKGHDIVLFGSRPPESSRVARGKLLALLAGVNKYMVGANLRGCANDVRAFTKLFRDHPTMFGPPKIATLLDESATASRIREELKRLSKKSRVNDVLVLVFSGHLIRPSEPATRTTILAHDYMSNGKGKGEVPLAEVVQIVRAAKAKYKILILD